MVETDVDRDGYFNVSLPAWQDDSLMRVSIFDIAPEDRTFINEGFRCFVKANIGAECAEDLMIIHWFISEIPSITLC